MQQPSGTEIAQGILSGELLPVRVDAIENTKQLFALSLTQPWATLVAIGAKRFETRSWGTSYRGALAIHASKGFPAWARLYCDYEPFKRALADAGFYSWRQLPTGVIVALSDLEDCTPTNALHRSEDFEKFMQTDEYKFGDYTANRFAWKLNNIRQLEQFVTCTGTLKLWRVPDDVTTEVMRWAIQK